VWVVAIAIVAALGLLGAILASSLNAIRGDAADDAADRTPVERDDPTTTEAPATTAPADDGSEAALETVVAEIEAFVAEERGLPFLRDVAVELADDAAFEARLLEDFDEDAAELALQGRVLEAVGLVEPGTDLVEAMRSLLGAGVVGFYDTETDELVVRGTSTSPYVRTVIAHELTHALDDQHFELFRPELDDATDETGFGFIALVEGNASRVEEAYRATFSAEEERQAFEEELSVGADLDIFSIPEVLFALIGAPYVLGPELVAAILDAGGQSRLDAAFALPPATSEHVLEPDTYLQGDGPAEVAAPTPDGPVVDEGMLGALGLALVLGDDPLGIAAGQPSDVVSGWGGDRYVAWDDPGGGTCLRATILGDTPTDTAEIRDALAGWAADDAPGTVDATVEGGDAGAPVTFTSCSS